MINEIKTRSLYLPDAMNILQRRVDRFKIKGNQYTVLNQARWLKYPAIDQLKETKTKIEILLASWAFTMIKPIQQSLIGEKKVLLARMIYGLTLHVQSQIPKSVIRQNRTIKNFNIFSLRQHQPGFILEQVMTHSLWNNHDQRHLQIHTRSKHGRITSLTLIWHIITPNISRYNRTIH